MEGWNGFWELARKLAAREGEAEQRTAISRAYYAVFHAARDWAKAHGADADTTGAGGHSELWLWFRARPMPGMDTIARDGSTLKRQRQLADYEREVTQGDLKKLAQAAVIRARDTIQLLATLK